MTIHKAQLPGKGKVSKRKLYVAPDPDEQDFCLKVGFMTLDRQHVDQHFGSAKTVLIYGVNRLGWHVLEAIEYPGQSDTPHHRLPARIQDLQSCAAVFCNACGASAVRQLIEQNIHPVKVAEGTSIHELLANILHVLSTEPAGWVAQAIKQPGSEPAGAERQRRLSELMDEDW